MQKRITTLDFSPLLRNAIGVDTIFENMLDRVEHANNGNYPPYNIIEVDENSYCIELAIAGVDLDDIDVMVDKGVLFVSSRKKMQDSDSDVVPEKNYLHNGISAREFERTFALADYIEVRGAFTKNGILTIELERNVPEALKPKTIKIEKIK